jgi:hypothetical protein
MNYLADAILVEIDENRVVVLDGREYLVIDKNLLKIEEPKKEIVKKERKPSVSTLTRAFTEPIIEILKDNPGAKSSFIRQLLWDKYGLKIESVQLRTIMQTIRKDGKIRAEGEKAGAVWYVKEEEKSILEF